MLPPVAALSDTSVDLSGQSAQPPTLPRIELSLGRTGDHPGTSTSSLALGAGRFVLLSLSGQMQLSQGLSVVAETIGALLKINRHAGESLVDYTERLAEVISGLSGPEKLALQRALNQLMQGFSLRLLTEILKNPFGPEATRVALQMEAAAYDERNPVTRRVVTSYRQNAGAEAAPLPPGSTEARLPADPRLNPPVRTAAAPLPLADRSRQTPSPAQHAMASLSHALPEESIGGRPDTTGETHAGPGLSGRDASGDGNALPPQRQVTQRAATHSTLDEPKSADSPHGSAQPRAAAPPVPIADAPLRTSPAAPKADLVSSPFTVLAAEAAAAPEDVTYDGPALARLMTGIADEIGAPAGASRAGVPLAPDMPITAAWLSDLYVEDETWPLPGQEPAPDDAAPQMADMMSDGSVPERLAADSRTAPEAGEPADTATAGQRRAGSDASSPAPFAAVIAAQTQSGPSAVPPVREVAVPVYVPYGPQGMPEDEDGPLVKAVEAEDEEREPGRRRGGRQGSGAHADPDATEQDSEPADAQASDEPSPDTLALPDDFAVLPEPAAFLPPESSAHGFYQRLAAW